MTKTLGLDRHGVPRTMRLRSYLADGVGGGGMNLIMALAGQVSYFYTEKVGIAAGTVAAVMLISKIIDAVTDLPWGKAFDNSKNPKGRALPWIGRSAIPAMIVIVLLFTIPQGMNAVGQIAYLMVTNVLLTAVVYTAFTIPYTAMVVMRTRSVDERSSMQVTRSIASFFFGAIGTVTVIPITNMLGGTQEAWIRFAVVAGLVGALLILITWKFGKESNDLDTAEDLAEEQQQREEERALGFWKSVGMLFRCPPWVFSLLIGVTLAVNFGLGQSAGTYYAKYIYGNDNLAAVVSGIGLLGVLAGFFVAKPMITKLGVTNTVILSVSLPLVASLIRVFIPYELWPNVILTTLSAVPMVGGTAATYVMANNAIAFVEKQYGVKLLGMSNSVTGMANQISAGIGISLITFVLAITGYDPALDEQPTSVIFGIFTFAIYIPILLGVFKLFVARAYKPYEAAYYTIMAERYGYGAHVGTPGDVPAGAELEASTAPAAGIAAVAVELEADAEGHAASDAGPRASRRSGD